MVFVLVNIFLLLQAVLATIPAPQNGLWISTIDEPVACRPSEIVYRGGQGPYSLVVDGTDYSTELHSLGEMAQPGTFCEPKLSLLAGLCADIPPAWTVNVQVDTAFAIRLTDCNGNSKLTLCTLTAQAHQ